MIHTKPLLQRDKGCMLAWRLQPVTILVRVVTPLFPLFFLSLPFYQHLALLHCSSRLFICITRLTAGSLRVINHFFHLLQIVCIWIYLPWKFSIFLCTHTPSSPTTGSQLSINPRPPTDNHAHGTLIRQSACSLDYGAGGSTVKESGILEAFRGVATEGNKSKRSVCTSSTNEESFKFSPFFLYLFTSFCIPYWLSHLGRYMYSSVH
ncbi:hypothetical protein DL96DRAFT_611889 [Flagelloscypha sp. PMI_526]|nr:hypothetical protein DL96DRAFT_611889 [Flagelloscypha sp. PMI_526]